MKKIIHTDQAPAAIGPYSQGVACSGQFVFVSGQLPIDVTTGEFAGDDIQSQTRQSLKNVQAILAAADMTMADVVSATVYLAHLEDFQAMNDVYAEFFATDCPSRAAFEVVALPKGALVEIQAIACR